ncbi:MAG TPA: adenylate/guanylate cyclase domain-containing protein, partial [Anaerolineales bacterium]|nr:adenylate/guanylate cyclase domain-containing protein [Anaerolineales bacterium]
MAEFPTGTVTFLFTDIEGSTQLWEKHPEAMKAALAKHDSILLASIALHGGYVFKTVGDAFCAAFQTASQALFAAIDAQRSLFREAWGEATIKVRMGLHTGDTVERDNDYFGNTLNRVARLMSAGHGGQVLVSLATQELIRDILPEGVHLRDLGERRLKDLIRPERIYQVNIEGLPAEFNSLKTLDAYRHNLPAEMTSFIGREKEIVDIKKAINEHRLVTLAGSGGTGKTRLSLHVAADLLDQFPDGVWLVELAPLSDERLVPQAVASVLEVREEAGRPVLETLVTHLKDKQVLIILDNCEHLLQSSAHLIKQLMQSDSRLKILATSREQLHIAGEIIYNVPSLSTPDPKILPANVALTPYESVHLFVDRAMAVQPTFLLNNHNATDVAEICYRLDGIPLAIELAAARVRALSVEKIAERLGDRFRLLTGGDKTALPHQQTLRATIDWSYNLLSEPERTLLESLSVFAGGWTLEAAEAIGAAKDIDELDVLNCLTNLVNKSLVILNSENERYGMLETVKQYAREKLVAGGNEYIYLHAHVEFYLKLSEEAELYQNGAEQVKWLNRLEAEHENFRVALEWSLRENMDESALRIAGALGQFWWVHSHLREGREWLRRVLMTEKGFSNKAQAKALFWSGVLARQQGDYSEAKE